MVLVLMWVCVCGAGDFIMFDVVSIINPNKSLEHHHFFKRENSSSHSNNASIRLNADFLVFAVVISVIFVLMTIQPIFILHFSYKL